MRLALQKRLTVLERADIGARNFVFWSGLVYGLSLAAPGPQFLQSAGHFQESAPLEFLHHPSHLFVLT